MSPVPHVGIVIASLESGGAERQALTLMHALHRRKVDVRLFCLETDREMELPGTEEERAELDSRIHVLGSQRIDRSTVSKALALPAMAIKLQREVRKYRLNVVISFMERANIVSLLGRTNTARLASVRTHISHGLIHKKKDPLKRLLIRFGYQVLARRSARIIFNSREAADDFAQQFPFTRQALTTIYNFPPSEITQHSQASIGDQAEQFFADGPVVMSCGRLIRAKGHKALLRAFAAIAKEIPGARLVILGEGPQRQHLQHLRTHFRLEDRVLLPGFQQNPYAWLRRCSLFVLPSRTEGFPNALLEAMLLGRPVIATDCPSGPRELLDPDSPLESKTSTLQFAPFGILTPPLEAMEQGDDAPLSHAEQALAESIRTLLTDESLRRRYAGKAKERMREFDHEVILDKWIDAIASSAS